MRERPAALPAAVQILIGIAAAIAAWWALTAALALPHYVLPSPWRVALAFVEKAPMLARNTAVTALEIGLGLLFGVAIGVATALGVAASPLARRLVLPVIVVSQTLPVFAIAPLLVVWLGYGLASKIVMTVLIIYFPIATAYAEAMLRLPRELIDLARLNGASARQLLFIVRAPGGLPGLAAGTRVAATVAPIGAVVGEWVGASQGLGYVMLHANARLQTDTLFAALICLAILALLVRLAVDKALDALVPFQRSS
ncbi:MAG: ABC transporter permease [Acuticoccus sp.]